MKIKATLAIGLLIAYFICESDTSVSQGQCDKARKGGIHEKCSMKCQRNGKCKEVIETEDCGCDGYASFSALTYNYKVYKKCIYFIKIKIKVTSIVNGFKSFVFHFFIITSRMEGWPLLLEERSERHQQEDRSTHAAECQSDAPDARIDAIQALLVLGKWRAGALAGANLFSPFYPNLKPNYNPVST